MTTSFKKISLGSAAIVVGALLSTAASAQSTRTWVSGVGDDVNPCSRTAPCKTFAGALANTTAGGEINCLDAGGYGTVTITQSVSIVCDNVEAGVLASGTDGIVVAAGATDTVVISGLDIQGSSSAGNGIRFASGGVLRVSNVRVSGFVSANYGINIAPTTSFAQVFLNNINVSGNGYANTGGGIFINPQSNTAVTVSIKHAIVQNNANVGLRIDTQGKTSAGAFTVIDDGIFTSDNVGIVIRAPSGTGYSPLTVVNSVFSRNVYGVSINTPYAPLLGRNTITDNTYGVYLVGGTSAATSFGDNHLSGNVTDGTFTTTVGTK